MQSAIYQHNTTPGGCKRQSNLELLRIVSMGLVLLIHYIPTRGIPDTTAINQNFWETTLNLELRSLAFVCVNCFILISGYFGIRWKLRSISHLLHLIVFWSVIACAINKAIPYISDLPSGVYGTDYIGDAFTLRWFIGAYLCLYLIAPIINSYIEKSTNTELGKYILLFYLFSTIFGYFMRSDNFNEGMSEISLAGLYLIGAYIRKTSIKLFTLNYWTDLCIYLMLGFGIVVLNIITLKIGFSKSPYGYLNPIVLLQSVYLFLFFKKLPIKHNPIINFIAASTFSAYLFHTSVYIQTPYDAIGRWANGFGSITSIGIITMVIIGIMIFCALIDCIGNPIFRCMYNKLLLLKSTNY